MAVVLESLDVERAGCSAFVEYQRRRSHPRRLVGRRRTGAGHHAQSRSLAGRVPTATTRGKDAPVDGYRARDFHDVDEPAIAITKRRAAWSSTRVLRATSAARTSQHRPLTSRTDQWQVDTRAQGQHPDGGNQRFDANESPTLALTSKTGGQWVLNPDATESQPNHRHYSLDELNRRSRSGTTLTWTFERPATIAGDTRAFAPGGQHGQRRKRQRQGDQRSGEHDPAHHRRRSALTVVLYSTTRCAVVRTRRAVRADRQRHPAAAGARRRAGTTHQLTETLKGISVSLTPGTACLKPQQPPPRPPPPMADVIWLLTATVPHVDWFWENTGGGCMSITGCYTHRTVPTSWSPAQRVRSLRATPCPRSSSSAAGGWSAPRRRRRQRRRHHVRHHRHARHVVSLAVARPTNCSRHTCPPAVDVSDIIDELCELGFLQTSDHDEIAPRWATRPTATTPSHSSASGNVGVCNDWEPREQALRQPTCSPPPRCWSTRCTATCRSACRCCSLVSPWPVQS